MSANADTDLHVANWLSFDWNLLTVFKGLADWENDDDFLRSSPDILIDT